MQIKKIEFFLERIFIHKNIKGVIVINEIKKDIKKNFKDNKFSVLYPIILTKKL